MAYVKKNVNLFKPDGIHITCGLTKTSWETNHIT